MSNIKVRHNVERKTTGEEETQTLLGRKLENEEDDTEEPYRYWVLLRSFIYALVVCIVLSSLILSQIVVIKTKEQQQSMDISPINYNYKNKNGGIENASAKGGIDLRQSVEKMMSSAMNKMSFKDSTSRSVAAAATSFSSSSSSAEKAAGKCAGQWSPRHLTGRCYGLQPHTEFSELKNIRKVKTAAACQELCCRMGAACQTWQYWLDLQVCKMGAAVTEDRRGGKSESENENEREMGRGGDPQEGPWCEQRPPVTWKGGRVVARDDSGGVQWGPDPLDSQCFGLEAASAPASASAHSLPEEGQGTEQECRADCAQRQECTAWQFHADRGGCFHSLRPAGALLCEPYRGQFDGGAKIARGET
jgi:hypothetical protein